MDDASYRAAAASAGGDLVPVLEPADPSRWARWARVLDWYGVVEIAGDSRRDTIRASPPDQDHAVVAVSPDAQGPASVLARGLARQLLVVRSVREAAHVTAGCASATVVALAAGFDRETWHQLVDDVPTRGVVVAADIPGLSFAVLKIIAAARAEPDPSWIMLSGVDDGRILIQEDRGENRLADDRGVAQILAARTAGTIVLRFHGGLGHLDVGGLLICGAHTAARSTASCRLTATGANCRRVRPTAPFVVALADVRARTVAVLSCALASADGRPYHGGASFPLALAEGYAAASLLSDRLVDPDEAESLGAALLIAAGCAGEALGAINAAAERRTGHRPYVLVGNPAPSGRLRSPEDALRKLPRVAVVEPAAGRVFDASRGAVVLASATYAAALSGRDRDSAPSLRDMTRTVGRLEGDVRTEAADIDSAERALEFFAREGGADRERLDAAMRLLVAAKRALRGAATSCAHSRSTGRWHAEIEPALAG